MKKLILLLCLCSYTLSSWGQTDNSPYDINLKKELNFAVVAGTTIGLGYFFKNRTQGYTEAQIYSLNTSSLNFLDQSAPKFNSSLSDEASDVLLYGSLVVNAGFLLGKETRKEYGKIALLWGETAVINVGITRMAKHLARRPRPYVYNNDVDVSKKQSAASRTSFFSGHTSITAANTFFFAKVYSDYYPDSDWKPVVWTAAAIIPAATGYFRVRAGKHFPTDVIIGYAVGASIGVLIPHLHKNRKAKDKGLTVYGGGSGLALNYRF